MSPPKVFAGAVPHRRRWPREAKRGTVEERGANMRGIGSCVSRCRQPWLIGSLNRELPQIRNVVCNALIRLLISNKQNPYWTNPLRGSGAASAAMASRGKARHSGRAWCQHARNRIVRQSLSATLVDRLSQPRVAADTQRCLQRFDSAADLKQTKPILARSTPYPHWLYPPHRVFHRSAGRHWPTFTTIAPWINSTAPASASRGDRLG